MTTFVVILTAAIFGLTYGLSAPLIALELVDAGYSETIVGANSAMHAIGVLLIAPFCLDCRYDLVFVNWPKEPFFSLVLFLLFSLPCRYSCSGFRYVRLWVLRRKPCL